MKLAVPKHAIVNAGRRLARGCRPVCVAACLSAALWVMPAAWGQDATLEAVGRNQADEQALAETLDRKMRTPATVAFKDTPLSEAIGFLGTHADVSFVFDLQAFEDAGVQTDTPVTLDVHDISLESVLAWLLHPLELGWAYRHDTVMITAQDAALTLQSTRFFSVGDLLERIGTHQADALSMVVRDNVGPTAWVEVGGHANGSILGDCLVVCAERSMHREIVRFMDDLRRAYDMDAPAAEDPDRAVLASLSKHVDVAFEDTPLAEACAVLAEQSGANIFFDKEMLADDRVDIHAPVTLHARDISLQSALKLLLSEFELTLMIRHEVLVITTRVEAESLTMTRLYPLGDLADDARQAERIREFLETFIAPTTWDRVGGPGYIWVLPDLLLVQQNESVQEEVAGLLARLRAGGPLWREFEGRPGFDGYRRVVYSVSDLSPGDVAQAIEATISPKTWQAGQGSIQVIHDQSAPQPADAASTAAADGPPANQNDPAPADATPAPVTGRLIIVQRPIVHAEIARLLRELRVASKGGDPNGMQGQSGGGFLRVPQ